MSELKICVATGPGQAPSMRAARCLAAVWGPSAQVMRHQECEGNPGYVLGIRPASLVRDTVTLDYQAPTRATELSGATAIGASIAAWDGLDVWEPWRSLHAPLPRHLGLGRIDLSRPWMLVDGSDPVACALLSDGPDLPWQVHAWGTWARPHPRVEVTWANPRQQVAAVLGRASVVLGTDGPLVYDAWRAHVEVAPSLRPGTRPLLPGALQTALAQQIPPALLEEIEIWDHVKAQLLALREGASGVSPTMLPALISVGRNRKLTRLASRPLHERTLRKLRKLQREPRAFFRDALSSRGATSRPR